MSPLQKAKSARKKRKWRKFILQLLGLQFVDDWRKVQLYQFLCKQQLTQKPSVKTFHCDVSFLPDINAIDAATWYYPNLTLPATSVGEFVPLPLHRLMSSAAFTKAGTS